VGKEIWRINTTVAQSGAGIITIARLRAAASLCCKCAWLSLSSRAKALSACAWPAPPRRHCGAGLGSRKLPLLSRLCTRTSCIAVRVGYVHALVVGDSISTLLLPTQAVLR